MNDETDIIDELSTNPIGAAADTLMGDVRDHILAEFKASPKPWQQSTEREQERLISRAWDIAERLVVAAVNIVASRGEKSLPITVGKLAVEGSAIKGVFECSADDESLITIRHLQGRRAMFILADAGDLRGQRSKPKPDNVGELAIPPGANVDITTAEAISASWKDAREAADIDAAVITADEVEDRMQAEADADGIPDALRPLEA